MRLLNKIYAKIFGYFWLPCPVCGRMFGGHEISNLYTAALFSDDGHAYCVCPDPLCSEAATVLNMGKGYPVPIRLNKAASKGERCEC